MLVAYLRDRCGDDIRRRAARYRESGNGFENSLIQAIEDVLHGWPRDAGDAPHIIDLFVADQPALSAADRRMARQWKDVRRGVFRIDGRKGRYTRMHNLIDEFDYQVLISGGGGDDLETFAPGNFLIAIIVPLRNAWILSGTQTILGAIDPRAAYGTAARLVTQWPAEFFRNPKHLERSRELGRLQHERFVRIFGHSWVVGTAPEIEDAHHRYVVENNRLSVAEGKASPADVARVRPSIELPPELRSPESVGMLSHPEQGLFFLAEFRRFLEAFAEPARAAEAGNRRRVLKYLEDDSIPAVVFEMVAGAEPDKATETMRRVLGDSDFDWRRDADRLLREHKPGYFEKQPHPSILALSREMVEGLRYVDQLEKLEGGPAV